MLKKLLKTLRGGDHEIERRVAMDMRDFIQGKCRLRVVSPDGEIVHDHSQPSNSWVKNAYNVAFCSASLCNPLWHSELGLIREDGTTYTPGSNASWSGWHASAPDNIDTRGILCGISAAAEVFTDYKLTTQCSHGVGVNQFDHQAQALPGFTWNGTTKVLDVDHYREFYNTSGAAILVEEIALYDGIAQAYGGLMMCRDLVGTTSVADLYTLQVTYSFKLTYTPIAP